MRPSSRHGPEISKSNLVVRYGTKSSDDPSNNTKPMRRSRRSRSGLVWSCLGVSRRANHEQIGILQIGSVTSTANRHFLSNITPLQLGSWINWRLSLRWAPRRPSDAGPRAITRPPVAVPE
jgi:hypothetical protein